MAEKYNKPLIIITAALSIAVITLSVQVVLLTFSVKDQKDTAKQLISRTNSAYAVENRYAELNGLLQQHNRDIDQLRNDIISVRAELDSFREILSKMNTDGQFTQMELKDIRASLKEIEERLKTTTSSAQSVGEQPDQPLTENSLYPTELRIRPFNSPELTPPAANQSVSVSAIDSSDTNTTLN